MGTSTTFTIPDSDAANFQGDLIAYLACADGRDAGLDSPPLSAESKSRVRQVRLTIRSYHPGLPTTWMPPLGCGRHRVLKGFSLYRTGREILGDWPQPMAVSSTSTPWTISARTGMASAESPRWTPPVWLNVAGDRRLTVVSQSTLLFRVRCGNENPLRTRCLPHPSGGIQVVGRPG